MNTVVEMPHKEDSSQRTLLYVGNRVLVTTQTLYYFGRLVREDAEWLYLEDSGIFLEVDNMTRTQDGVVKAEIEHAGGNGMTMLRKQNILSVLDGNSLKIPPALKGLSK